MDLIRQIRETPPSGYGQAKLNLELTVTVHERKPVVVEYTHKTKLVN